VAIYLTVKRFGRSGWMDGILPVLVVYLLGLFVFVLGACTAHVYCPLYCPVSVPLPDEAILPGCAWLAIPAAPEYSCQPRCC
jgi:hypothetical protein